MIKEGSSPTFHHIRICFINYLSGIIITGGYEDDTRTSVEVWPYCKPDVPFGSPPQLPEGRRGHTQTGLTACGEYGSDSTQTSCVTLSGLGWIKTYDLIQKRSFHTAWETRRGIILLGGYDSPTTTELLKEDGGSEETFPLKYPSR